MKNIRIPKDIGNSIVKHAYLELIYESIKKISKFSGLSHIELRGYEDDKDRVHFQYGGKKCELYGAFLPSIYDPSKPDNITLMVKTPTANGITSMYDLTIDARDFRFDTLNRIAYEVYDYCKGEDDPEYEEAIKDCIAECMDDYREFMS